MKTLHSLSEQLGGLLANQQQILASAESCTGGGVAYWVTEVAGSSAWFDRSFVTYSNEAKQEMLGVRQATLQQLVRFLNRPLKRWRLVRSCIQRLR